MAEPVPTPAAEPVEAPPIRAYSPEAGRVALFDENGELQTVPIENAERAVREHGYRPATKAETVAATEGTVGTVKAGIYGAARGASFGTFDPIAVEASRAAYGEEGARLAREELNLVKQGHETATMAGEVVGSLAPLVLSGGGGAAVTGESLLARTGQRILGAAPRAFLEGAAIADGQQLSEDTLGNHELVASKYLTTGVEGGVLGMILGAGLHAGVGVAGEALAARAARKAASGATREAGGLGSRLADIAEEQAAKGALPSASMSAGELQKLGRTAEEQQTRMRQIGRTLLEEGITTPGATKATQAVRLTERIDKAGAELATQRKALERSAIRPSAEAIVDRLEKEVVGPMMTRPFSFADQAAAKPYIADVFRHIGGSIGEGGAVSLKKPTLESFDQLFKIRSALGKKLEDMKSWEKANLGASAPGHADLRHVYGILEGEFEKAAERASLDLGEDVAQKYRVTKALFEDLKTAEKWAKKGAARDAQNQAISLSDIHAGSAGISTAVAGMIAGHPVAALAALAGPANKLRRTFGKQVVAVVTDRAAKILGVQRAAERFDVRLAKAVDGFYAGGKTGAKVPSGAKPTVDPETARALRAAVSNPAALTAHVTKTIGATGLRESAPKIAQAMTSTVMRAAAWLGQSIPPEPPPASFTFSVPKPRALGPHAQAKLEAAVGALDLDGLLADIERGRVDRQRVEALRIISPPAHAAIIGALEKHGREHAAELTHQQEVALSILTGKPIGAMMQPRTIRGFQQAHIHDAPPDPAAAAGASRQKFGGGSGDAGGGSMGRSANTFRSGSDRMEAGDG